MKEIDKQKLLTYTDFLTVGKLKEILKTYEGLSDDSIVVVERVEDYYYNELNWGVYLKEGEAAYEMKMWNEDIKGEYLDKTKYPKLVGRDLKHYTDKEIKEAMTQYHPVFCCPIYNNDKDILFLDLHY